MAAPRQVDEGNPTVRRLDDDLVLRQRTGNDPKVRAVQDMPGAQLAQEFGTESLSLLRLGANVSEWFGEPVVAAQP